MGILVIHRNVGEYVKIGSAWVQVSRVRGDKVSLAIVAPSAVNIARREHLTEPVPQEFHLTNGGNCS